MKNGFLLSSILVGAALLAGQAAAQVTPSDVRDLVGARGSSGESELASRGYVNVGGQRSGDDRKWTYWWNDRRGVCLSVSTVNGRYDSIVSTPAPDCRKGGGNASNGGGGHRPPAIGYGPGPPRGHWVHYAPALHGAGRA